MSRHLLPLSIFALAAAVAFHAIAPAHAEDTLAVAPRCEAYAGNNIATQQASLTAISVKMHGEGRRQFFASGLFICGWN